MSESEKSVTEAASAAFEGVEGAVGLGVDIVEIARMRRILERTPSFREKVFSEEERSYCESTANPEVHYATRFAAKEAVLKALGTGFSRGIANHDVEVRRNAKGRPFVVLHGRAKEVADEQSVRELPLSLSYTHTEAVACAMAITEASVRAAEERVNPMEELARQFKEARGMLDELGPASKPDGGPTSAAEAHGGPAAGAAGVAATEAVAANLSAMEMEAAAEAATTEVAAERPAG